MKKIKYLYLTLLVAILGCQDAIDIQQPGRITLDVAFRTVDDLSRGLNGAYLSYDLVNEIAMAAAYTDEVGPGVASGGQNFTTGFIFELNPLSSASSTFWAGGYLQLNRLNRLLEGAAGITPTPEEEDEYNDIVGQALALRAYSHFQLLSYYSTDYTNDEALGVPIQIAVPSIADQPLRNTNGEVYQQIEDDLSRAFSLIQDDVSATRTFVSKDFVLALRARVAAYRGDYSTALPIAQDLLNRYPLATTASFPDIWLDESNDEVIFKLERVLNGPFDGQGSNGAVASGGWVGNVFAFVNASAGGGAFFEFGRTLFNLFEEGDIRRTAYLAPDAVVSPDYENTPDYLNDDVLPVAKYPGSQGQFLMNDHKVFRSAEMLLIIAEAYADSNNLNGPTNSVAATLKQLRDARFGTAQGLDAFNSQQDAFNAILNERRVELAFEGHRWKDVKRLGARANQNIVREPLDCDQFNACELSNSDFRMTIPLPVIEFEGNPGLREQQNPGYTN
ncbi:RagB/SusD family nutrient uptake outer membrane protein [Winogradskyella sp.]|uniref:RagB/SusD family nutrient uptake outer membrane protein n=1 Tax=Winogradskyella sp. TaxID=1883156 RepID=UPI002628550F|nr:RagB/SusD family nutrient uptake outer membrane protein [Winogradskyella sp.]